MSALSPGLYRATLSGKSHDGILDRDGDFSYLSSDGLHCTWSMGTDARPLIVLDLAEKDARHLVSYLQITVECHPDQLGTIGRGVYTNVAKQIKAQTKPARIPEPGLWGVVEARYVSGIRDAHWVRDKTGWITVGDASPTRVSGFEHLVDPTLIREGVTP